MAPKFSLQTVLDVRHMRVEALEIELGELLSSQRQGQAFLEQLQVQMKELFAALEAQQTGEIDLFAVSMLRSNIRTTNDQVKQVTEALAIVEKRIEIKRQEVVSAKQEEEALVILKNKEIERFNIEQNIRDARLQDEIYIAQAFRKRSQE